MRLIAELCKEHRLSAIINIHDVMLAQMFAERIVGLRLGEIVDAFPGHIACDAAARSEVVVPVDDAAGELAAVLDVDSHQPAAFDEEDRAGLEGVAAVLSRHLAPAAAVR
jgi:hypothetical protein